ncbi:methyltransferase N6AMT1 [Venturia canescens]|uniref:methyltransferase N6AMT1 n=1 Tax=Venturia canescens TaxID=32260 RepID=UPI001C9C7610|nr:methyltransferase N6AMT1 [Venturia canescens]
METPIVRLSEEELERVYEPAEDSYLLIDALELDLEKLKLSKPSLCLEIGSGSGIVSTALALAAAKSWPSYFVAIDLNPEACKITKRTGRENNIDLEVVRMDLASALSKRHTFDLIIFNPPYVVTESREIEDVEMITRAWAGGKKGREVMDRLFANIPQLLTDHGLFYLLVLRENEPNEIITIFEAFQMSGEIIVERKIRGEHLYVIRFTKVPLEAESSL